MRSKKYIYGFIIRLLICFLIFGGAYFLFLSGHNDIRKQPLTTQQKVAKLKSDIDQTLITATAIGSYKTNSLISSYDLNTLLSNFQSNISAVSSDIKNPPKILSQSLIGNTKNLVNLESQSRLISSNTLGILSTLMSYDPSNDLGGIDLTTNSSTVVARASAAKNGLQSAANNSTNSASTNSDISVQGDNGPTSLINSNTKSLLTNEANCFNNLVNELNQKKINQANNTRKTCISNYVPMRQAAITNVISSGFSPQQISLFTSLAKPIMNKLASN